MLIKIDITNKRPQVDGTPVIVCGNNDYHIQFTFDEEWAHSQMKTARFAWRKGGKALYIDVPFVGDTVDVPMLSEVHFVYVGVYTDSLHTTTPARIACEYSIRCNSGEDIQAPTPEDVLIDLFNLVTSQQDAAIESADIAVKAKEEAEAAADTAVKSEAEAREAAADALACVGTSVRVLESNSGDAITFWAGTKEQYDALPEKVANCMYIITDDTTGEDLAKACADAAAAAAEALAYSAGYGLGGYGKNITISDIADLDGITANGWYGIDIPDWIADTADFGGINVHTATMRVDAYGGNVCRQTLYPIGNYATSIVRLKYISWDLTAKWSPWYVENPPMDPEVEYRTTERWQGSPVYVKCIKFPVGSDALTWDNVISSSYTVVGADFLYNNTPAPYYRGSDLYACPVFDGATLNFWVDGGSIPGTLTATIRYTK